MTQRIVVIGVGGSGPDSLTPAVLARIEQADQLWGGKRLLEHWADHPGEQMVIGSNIPRLIERLRHRDDQRIVILASGDPGFYGIAGTLLRRLPPEEVEIVPHVSSLQTAFARAGIVWSDAVMTSAHARPLAEIVGWARRASKLGILTDHKHTPAMIAQTLLDAGLPDCRTIVGERLGMPEEKLTDTRLANLPGMDFDELNVLLLVQDEGWQPQATFAPRPEDDYAHRRGLITKQDVRALSLTRLALRETDVAWDIGAGSGSVSVEMAELAWRGTVYAVERDKKNIGFIQKNICRYGTLNVKLIEGRAPDALERLLAPDAVFIGGTGGAMESILDKVQQEARPGCRVVINLATLENLNEALRITKSLGWAAQVTQVNIAQGKGIRGRTRLDPLNPVFIVSAVLES